MPNLSHSIDFWGIKINFGIICLMEEISKNMEGVKFVYFDVGNVLFSFSKGLENLAQKFSRSPDKVKKYWRSKDDDMCRGIFKPQEFWNQSKQHFKYSGPDINFVDFWIDHFAKIQKGHDLAYKLAKDFQVGLFTNAYPEVIEKVISTDLMPKINWATVIKSCDYGFIKPERELFDIALKKTYFKANEIVLIDDIQENCDKAIENGWRSILFS